MEEDDEENEEEAEAMEAAEDRAGQEVWNPIKKQCIKFLILGHPRSHSTHQNSGDSRGELPPATAAATATAAGQRKWRRRSEWWSG